MTLVNSLASPPLVVGHSLGGLIAQLVAARTRHSGLVAATPAPAAGIFAMYPGTVRVFSSHYLQPRPWTKPLHPTTWKLLHGKALPVTMAHIDEWTARNRVLAAG